MENKIIFLRKYWLELIVLFGAIGIFLLSLLDYSLNVPHAENYLYIIGCSLEFSEKLVFKDILNLINPCFEFDSNRGRFYTFLVWTLNTKFRMWLFEYVPYHATVSLTWVFTITLLPYFFFKLVKQLVDDVGISILATASLILSIGFLSTHNIYFWSAKPMTLLFTVLGLYWSSVISEKQITDGSVGNSYFYKWLLIIICSLFWDETYFIFFLIFPILFPNLVFDKALRVRTGLVTIFAFLFYCLIVLWAAPGLIRRYFNVNYDIFGFAFKSNSKLWDLKFDAIFYNIRSLISTHIDFWNPVVAYSWEPSHQFNLILVILFLMSLLLPLIYRSRVRGLYIRSLCVMFVYVAFLQLVLSRVGGWLIYGGAYWGSMFSVVFILVVSLYIASFEGRVSKYVYVIFYLVIMLAGVQNNYSSTVAHGHAMSQNQYLIPVNMSEQNNKYLNFQDVKKVWDQRHDIEAVKKILKTYPEYYYWLYYESFIQSKSKKVNGEDWGSFD